MADWRKILEYQFHQLTSHKIISRFRIRIKSRFLILYIFNPKRFIYEIKSMWKVIKLFDCGNSFE